VLGLVPERKKKCGIWESSIRQGGDHDTGPIGRPMAFYKASFIVIKRSIEELVKWLEK
jgi:hypothetical protein